jgi:hypothetical protein
MRSSIGAREQRPFHSHGIQEISMTKITRRAALAAAAAIATGSTLAPAPMRAAAPISGKQAPGFYRYKLGDCEVTVVNDGDLDGSTTSA